MYNLLSKPRTQTPSDYLLIYFLNKLLDIERSLVWTTANNIYFFVFACSAPHVSRLKMSRFVQVACWQSAQDSVEARRAGALQLILTHSSKPSSMRQAETRY